MTTTAPSGEASGRSPRAAPWAAATLAAVACVYAPALVAGFFWDDHQLVVENSLVRGPLEPIAMLMRPFWSGPLVETAPFYRPAVVLSLALDWRLGGGAPWAFHATNLAAHLGVVALLFALLLRTGVGARGAFVLATAFGLWPRLTESVAWISGRTDVLAALGGAAALVVASRQKDSWARRLAIAGLLLLGLLAKETAVAFAGALVALAWPGSASVGRAARAVRLAPVLGAVAIYAALRLAAGVSAPPGEHTSVDITLLRPIGTLGRYAVLTLDALRPRLQPGRAGVIAPAYLAAGLATLALIAWQWRRGRATRSNASRAAWTGAAAALALVLHLLPWGPDVDVADRFLYVPMFFVMLAVAPGLPTLSARLGRAARPAALLVLGALAASTSLRVQLWGREVALWRHTLATNPRTEPEPAIGLAAALEDRGRFAEALAVLDAMASDHPKRDSNRALCLDKLGRSQEAVAIYQRLLAAEPDRLRLRYNLVMALARAERFDEAETALADLERRSPGQVVEDIRSRIEPARTVLATLPAETPSEPVDVTLSRARAWTQLEAPARATPLWAKLVAGTAVDRSVILEALAYLARFGEPEMAAHVLAGATTQGIHPPAAAWQALLSERTEK